MRLTSSSTLKYCMLAIIMIMASGCENPYIKQVKDEFGWTEARMLGDGWLKTNVIAQPSVYCYHTLADADCFPKPKHAHKDRQINPSYNGMF